MTYCFQLVSYIRDFVKEVLKKIIFSVFIKKSEKQEIDKK